MDTVKEVKRASLPEDVALITGTVPRERVVLAQTPQAFSTKLLKEAFARAEADGVNASDEAGLFERPGHQVDHKTPPLPSHYPTPPHPKNQPLNHQHHNTTYTPLSLSKKKT